jgi:hypothetical protein
VLLLTVALVPTSAAIGADKLDESEAIRKFERLGVVVNPDDRTPGHNG